MKKLVLLLAVVASATLFSCSGSKSANDSSANAESAPAQVEETVETPANDSGVSSEVVAE